MIWECDGCGNVVEDDPHAHSDWGGVITVYGPHCQECDQPMQLSPDQDWEIVSEEGDGDGRPV